MLAQRWFESFGIDVHILATLLFRFWSVFAGGITVLLIPLCLEPILQGYYYTFASILALQIFFELGMGQVVLQIVAHEAAHLAIGKHGSYEGPVVHLARLSQIKKMLNRWYLWASLLFLVTVICAGLWFFRTGGLSWHQWAIPWILLVSATSINLFFSWKLAMVEGFGLVKDTNQLRLKQSIVGYLSLWIILLAGGGLWSTTVVPTIAAVISSQWLRKNPAVSIMGIDSAGEANQHIHWKRDIFPFQWRIAVSWISGYFIFQLFTPLIFKQQGAVEAGRLGLAITVFGAISTISMSWVNAKASTFSMLIAKKKSAELLVLFRSVKKHSVLSALIVSALFLIATGLGTLFELHIMQRIASLPVLACLAVVTIVNSYIFASAVFMRSHKEEPMLAVSITGGVITAIMAWFLSSYGVEIMMLGYAAVTLVVGLPWTLYIRKSYFKKHELSSVNCL